MTDPANLVVLISGSGTNLQAFIDAIKAGHLNANIAVVISNKADAFGLTRAQNAGIGTATIDHKQFADRESFDRTLVDSIDAYRPDAVILAGFMRILTAEFVQHYQGKLFNIHPSLLPKYPGLHTHQRAIDAGDKYHGATVHFVTEELDGGPPILQARVPILEGDNADTLAARVRAEEHKIYPLAIKWFVAGRLRLGSEGAQLDDAAIPSNGLRLEDIAE